MFKLLSKLPPPYVSKPFERLDIGELGRSMVEMLSVLAIIGVLSVGGIAGYSKAMEKHNLNKLKDQLFQIVSNISLP